MRHREGPGDAVDARADAIVVGGGAAGLAAAAEIVRAGFSAIVIEARERLGGRIATVVDPRTPVPMELGAEFVHGLPEATLARLRAIGATVVDTGESGWRLGADGALEPAREDPFAAVASYLGDAARDLAGDETIEAALARTPPASAETAAWTRSLVAGFDAADPARASLRAIAEEWQGDASAGGAQSRPLGGYVPLVDGLVRSVGPPRGRVLTRHVLTSLATSARGVRASGSGPGGAGFVLDARYAVATLPLGVLQRAGAPGGIAFSPPLSERKRRALAGLVAGPVRKVVLLFAEAFWERLDGGRLRDAAFFHRESGAFPTFWTQVPVRAPFVVAWAGGPAADALAERSDDDVAALALAEFGSLVRAEAETRAAFLAAFTIDWQRDPLARGAYSYVAAGGAGARAELAAFEGRTAFAGEATAGAGEGGTVAGALLSGERAGREIVERLRTE